MMNMGRLVVRIRSITTGRRFGNIASPSAGNAAGGTRPGKFDLNAVVTIPLLKGLAFQYEHDRCCGIDTRPSAVVTRRRQIGKQVHLSRDEQRYRRRLPPQLQRHQGCQRLAGYPIRFRHDNNATNDPTNLAPADWHQQSLTLGYTPACDRGAQRHDDRYFGHRRHEQASRFRRRSRGRRSRGLHGY